MKEYFSIYYLILFVLFPFFAVAQEQQFKVKNAMHQGIEGVFIINESGESTISESDGSFTLPDNGNRFTFSHINYKTIAVDKEYLSKFTTLFLEEKITSLDEVVIGANKWEESASENPQQILVVRSDEIQNELPRTSADILANTGEVFVQMSQMGGGSPMIRGFAANQIVLVVDGVRMNNAIYRNGNLQNILSVDPNNVENVEVIFGPGSVIYGSDALGGVIDFHTKKPQFSDKNELHGNSALRFSSATGEGMGTVQLNYQKEKFSWLGTASYSSFKDLKSGTWYRDKQDKFGERKFYVKAEQGQDIIVNNFANLELQKYSGYEQFSTLQKFRFQPTENLDITYALHLTTTSDIPRYDRLTELNTIKDDNGNAINVTSQDIIGVNNNQLITPYGVTTPKFSEWYYGPQYWLMNSLKLKLKTNSALFDHFKTTLSYQFVQEDRHNKKFNSTTRTDDYVDVDVYSINLDFFKKINPSWDVAYGLEGSYNNVFSKAYNVNINSQHKEATLPRYAGGGSNYGTYGIYGLGRYYFSEKFTASLGLRYTQTLIKADYTDPVSQNLNLPYDTFNYAVGSVTGSLGIAYHYDNWQIKGQFAKGFKAPNIDDIGKVYNPSKDDLVMPNPNLKPTDVYTLDATVERKFGDDILLSAVGYYSWLQNAMVRGPYQYQGQDSVSIEGNKYAVYALQNTGEARIYGFSVKANANITEELSIIAAYTLTYGEDLGTNNDRLRHIPPNFGKVALNYTTTRWHLGLSSLFSGGIAYEDLAPTEQEKPYLYAHDGALSWWTLNFQGSLRLKDFAEIHLNIDNIFDLSYRTYSSGINAPGRNFSLGVKGFF